MPNKRSRGEVRNSKLQKVAADLFLKRGYEGVTIDKIVELAGGSKSTVYSDSVGSVGCSSEVLRTCAARRINRSRRLTTQD